MVEPNAWKSFTKGTVLNQRGKARPKRITASSVRVSVSLHPPPWHHREAFRFAILSIPDYEKCIDIQVPK